MRSKVGAGIVGGLIAGVVFGMMMQMMTAPTPDGEQMPMMQMVAMMVGSQSMLVGWVYHLFNSAIIGTIFGWVLGNRAGSYGAGLGWGAAYGIFWWLLGAQILMPVFLGMPPFASIMDGAHAYGGDRQPGGAFGIWSYSGRSFRLVVPAYGTASPSLGVMPLRSYSLNTGSGRAIANIT